MMYAGTLSYFAQLQAQYELSALASKIKTLQLANQQGQQIYKIDNTNIDSVLPKLNLSDSIKNDIQNSINQGKYVITHTDNVSVPGWSGAGYAIIDPLTGSDAYMISGGENGAFLLLFSGAVLMFTAVAIMISTTGVAAVLALSLFSIGAALFIAGTFLASITGLLDIEDFSKKVFAINGVIRLLVAYNENFNFTNIAKHASAIIALLSAIIGFFGI